MSSTQGVVSANGVCKRFGPQRVVHSVSLSCSSGEVVLLLGANGAGKSTLLRMLAGLVRPDSGDVSRAPGTRVGFASHHTFLYSKLSVQENIRLYAALVRGDAHEHEELLTRWNVSNVAQTPIHQLSKGTQAKVSLIRALLGKPHILLLDEPSSNLDEQSVAVLLQEVRSQQARGVCIIATHDVARLRQIATRVIVLEKGAIVADSGPNASEQQRDQVVETYYQGNR